jgi:hypothetical protein
MGNCCRGPTQRPTVAELAQMTRPIRRALYQAYPGSILWIDHCADGQTVGLRVVTNALQPPHDLIAVARPKEIPPAMWRCRFVAADPSEYGTHVVRCCIVSHDWNLQTTCPWTLSKWSYSVSATPWPTAAM